MHIVFLGGGTGTSHLLGAFRDDPDIVLSALISTADDGGSTGVLRNQYGIAAVGDIRKNLSALSSFSDWSEYRFGQGFLAGHTLGNLWLLGLIESLGWDKAIEQAHTILKIKRHKVIPVTTDPHDIVVTLDDGTEVCGESQIITRSDISSRVRKIHLTSEPRVHMDALAAIRHADMIILGPTTFYTSLGACLSLPGIVDAIRQSSAKCVYIGNLHNFPTGNCQGYTLSTYLDQLNTLFGLDRIDTVLAHSGGDITIDIQGGHIVVDDFAQDGEVISGGVLDALPRNTFRHNAAKVLRWVKTQF